MAFPGGGGEVVVQEGAKLPEILTEALGFLSLGGEAKVKLLPSPWPSDNLPAPTASLMSVASHKGLIAAAGPDAVIVATTESVRKTFESIDGGRVKPFQPQLSLPMPMRISQVAFSADELYLVLSAENGGGLAVYEVQSLLNGSTQRAFELSTNSEAVRALIPNPTAEKGELIAVVTSGGNLMIANLKDRKFASGPSGQVLKTNVSCLSWSTKGKQLVAGLGDGSACQMTPEGEDKGAIPKPPNIDGSHHVSSITWLENTVFLLVYTPPSQDGGFAPSSTFNVVTRTSPGNVTFQNIAEPVGPFGMNRSPPHHFLLRLREFPPNLQDLVIVASTASSDVGTFSRSKVPLSNEEPAHEITNVFTLTEMSDDSRRAALPLSDSLTDTSPIGFALDLSSKERVPKPIPKDDEINETTTPLPSLMILNNEGVLASWWIVYSESVHQKTIYPGLVAAEGINQSQQVLSSQAQPPNMTIAAHSMSTPAFGAGGAFGAPSGLGQRTSVWGASAVSTSAATQNAPAFGSNTFGSTPAAAAPISTFGSSTFGAKPAASTPAPAFGTSTFGAKPAAPVTPAFGSTSTPTFGSSGLPGSNRSSPWATAGSTVSGSAFGQPSGLGQSQSVFGSNVANSGNSAAPTSGGFASFASKGGFAAAVPPTAGSSGSVFGASKSTASLFGAPSTASTSAAYTGNPFGISAPKSEGKPASLLGTGSFSLGSTFKADKSVKDTEAEPSGRSKSSFFGGNFENVLDNAAMAPTVETPVSKETEMESEAPTQSSSMTPASTPASGKPSIFGSGLGSGSLFGTPAPPTSVSLASAAIPTDEISSGKPALGSSKTGGFSFLNTSATPTAKPSTSSQPPNISQTPPSPRIKKEPTSPITGGYSEAPLPPDPTSKTSYAAGDTSGSSVETDAPLPPDFMPKPAPKVSAQPVLPPVPATKPSNSKSVLNDKESVSSEVPTGPGDDGDSSGFETEEGDEGSEGEVDESGDVSEEGSGEDVGQDLSPTSEINETPGITPEASFRGKGLGSLGNDLFAKVSKPGQQNPSRSLFGEVGNPAPIFPPPKVQASPRSPSPSRSAIPGRMMRPDATRSVSAPGVASQLLGRKPPPPDHNAINLAQQQQKSEEQRREEIKARKEAEEKQALVDDEDERMQDFLASDLEGTRELGEFIAHASYVGPLSKQNDSIASQVENVFRDINSMIDTLGVNARTLKSFMKGHTEQYKDEFRTREDLHDDDDWCLIEIENLSNIVEKQLGGELAAGRIQDVADKLETCNDLQKDLIRLHAKLDEIKKLRAAHMDGNRYNKSRAQPLGAEQAVQQNDLRRDFTKFQKLLSEAEEGLSVLKAKIVSQATSNGQNNGSAGPTVEAVMRTITKMTSMAEKRSGDIDVLEGHMRRLRIGSAASPRSREGSPFSTPKTNRTSMRMPGTSSTYGQFFTPESSRTTSRLQNSLMSSTSSRIQSSPPRKKLSGYSAEEKTKIREQVARKKDITNRLKEALKKSGTSVKLMGDE